MMSSKLAISIISYLVAAASSFSNKNTASTGDCLSPRTMRSLAYHNRKTSSQLQARFVNNGENTVKHSALAQVLANQYGVDLSLVQPLSNEADAKITAADVEYHAWKISQPPCTSEALEAAYSLGLNLNELYDDEDRQYVMNMDDIQLYVENLRSLKMSYQVKKNIGNSVSAKRERKMKALDKRVEQNMEKLTYKAMQAAMTVTDGIVQQVQTQIRKGLQNPHTRDKYPEKLETVADFDIDLAIEIQEALTVAGESSTDSAQSDERQNSNHEDVNREGHGDNYVMEELQNMTCSQLKDELRQRGMKISGKKADLVDRLLYWADPVTILNCEIKA